MRRLFVPEHEHEPHGGETHGIPLPPARAELLRTTERGLGVVVAPHRVVDRSELDELTGLFSGLKRSMMEGRIKDEAAVAMGAMRDRLERPGPRR